ncbi:MAG TPA: hypothetical protein VFG20_22940 [Planctomycetaceae bacterium]|nr:hypothetical protein [Planctomycetaceae bacterium]
MKQLHSWLLFTATVSLGVPTVLVAQIGPIHHPGCCDTCTLPMAACQCVQTRAVVQTQLRPQQVTSLKCVTETHVRKETYSQHLPVTTTETVTVDEGGYKMVWVPKPVTKQIARTTMTTQIKTRDVPYQVTRAVPHTETRMVPYQTVQHVTEVVPMAVVARPACNTCATGTAFIPHPHPHATASVPMSSAMALTPIPTARTAEAPASASPSHGDWQAIPARQATAPEPRSSRVPEPMDDIAPMATPKTSGRFKAAPSAAVVWSAVGRPAPGQSAQNLARNDQR